MCKKYDIIIIGAGPAGEKAAIQAAVLGKKVLVIDKSHLPGGASVLTGTIPSKAVRETANLIYQVQRKDLQGFAVGIPAQLTGKELFYRHNKVSYSRAIDILNDFKKYNIHYLTAAASFHDQYTILASNEKFQQLYFAPYIIIATGSKPYHPPDIVFDNVIHDSDSIIKLSLLPKSIIIYGAGVIGCEYASIFNCIGIDVTLVSPNPNLLSFIDQEISHKLSSIFESRGIKLLFGQSYKKIFNDGGQARLTLQSGVTLASECLLYCNGRQGSTNKLNLSAAGLVVNSREQLDVNNNYQTKASHIYAVGDVIGFPALASIANEQGRIAAQHALLQKDNHLNLENMPVGIYTIPEISMVGTTEDELQNRNIEYVRGICDYHELARAKLQGSEIGFLKILLDPKTKKFLGIHILGEHSSDLIHLGQAVLNLGGTADYFLDQAINFPTFSSAYKIAVQDAMYNLSKYSQST